MFGFEGRFELMNHLPLIGLILAVAMAVVSFGMQLLPAGSFPARVWASLMAKLGGTENVNGVVRLVGIVAFVFLLLGWWLFTLLAAAILATCWAAAREAVAREKSE